MYIFQEIIVHAFKGVNFAVCKVSIDIRRAERKDGLNTPINGGNHCKSSHVRAVVLFAEL